ncbi:unnamed protein product [Nezara viridula]|uniref:Uncharacterized protein n=1 Tax=Nezara viridula TaxID=85310 RepID=A0A9P0HQ32_NEZVI|nr:unnamed protein product [Nezara viridula]
MLHGFGGHQQMFSSPGSRSSSQGQVNSAVAAKEHSRVHLCLGLGPEKDVVISTHWIMGFGPNWRGWHATEHTLISKASNNLVRAVEPSSGSD